MILFTDLKKKYFFFFNFKLSDLMWELLQPNCCHSCGIFLKLVGPACPCRITPSHQMAKTSPCAGGTRRVLDQLKPLWFKSHAVEYSHKCFAVLDPQAFLMSLPNNQLVIKVIIFKVMDFLPRKQLIWQKRVTTNEDQPYRNFF